MRAVRCALCQHPVGRQCGDCHPIIAWVRETTRTIRAYFRWRTRPTLPERVVWCFLNDQDGTE